MKNQLLSFVLIFSLISCNSRSEDSEIIRNISTILKQEYSNPPKLIAFNNIENLIETLENSNELILSIVDHIMPSAKDAGVAHFAKLILKQNAL